MKIKEKSHAAPGRPREFDTEEALERGLLAFWRNGYEGTSMSDLTEALGINRPSLYAAFGNKEEFFRKALTRYEAGPASYAERALEVSTGRAAIEQILAGALDLVSDPDTPSGCLLVQGALVCSADSEPIRQELSAHRRSNEARLRERFEQAKANGELPSDADCTDLARYFTTVIRGLGIQAADGATREELERVAQMALCAWPTV